MNRKAPRELGQAGPSPRGDLRHVPAVGLDGGPEVDGTAAKPRQMAGLLELAQATGGDAQPLGGLRLQAEDRLHEVPNPDGEEGPLEEGP